ncbi:MAG: hypothetical protein A2075_24210 [Geobacteraceae bacterium GWC2_58_44]|nr:MAG: hypothetical protein A2075_24210 [Geobacteraceae bacterium GWC2_58_44]HBG05120.1 hypothetical protein [Geobacter sp.]
MTVRMTFVLLALLMCSGISHGKEDRWSNFAEDGDLKYYLDQKSIVPLPNSVYIFWVKSVAKDKNYFKAEYNLNNLSYILTNYELDCAFSSYRIRGTIMFDKNRRELNKSVSDGPDSMFEPVPPESVLELVQDEICVKEESADLPETDEPLPAAPIAVTLPLESAAAEDPAQAEPPSIQ